MRILFLLAALVLLATFAWPSMQSDEPLPRESWVSFEPVPLYAGRPGERRLGKLLFLGGWSLSSDHSRFGAISALHVADGQALALGDAGWATRFPLPAGALRAKAEIFPVVQGPGKNGKKLNRDIESLAVLGDQLWLGFEQSNAVWRYRLPDCRAQASAEPASMRKWNQNRGPEAMVRLADGRFLIFAEGRGGESEAALFEGDPANPATKAIRLRYRPPEGYRITDAAVLPDGRLLFLNRRARLFEGFSAKLTLGRLPSLHADALVSSGEEVAAFERPAVRENFEAMSLTREGGRTILWIASDDNYNGFQRSLLLKFALAL